MPTLDSTWRLDRFTDHKAPGLFHRFNFQNRYCGWLVSKTASQWTKRLIVIGARLTVVVHGAWISQLKKPLIYHRVFTNYMHFRYKS